MASPSTSDCAPPTVPASSNTRPIGASRPGAEERAIACVLAALLPLRALEAFRWEIDSDEPQHLHVVWGWAHGLLQYRDVFDNHMPLFHILSAPLLRLVGERSDVLSWMRLPLIAVYAASLLATFAIGRALFSRRAGLWAALLAGLFPPFFFCSLEFRPDGFWTLLWLGAVGLLVSPSATRPRSLAAGLLLGAAVGVSTKSALMLAALAAAASGVALLPQGASPGNGARGPRVSTSGRSSGVDRNARAIAFLVGISIVPLALVVFFAAKRALPDLLDGVLVSNALLDPHFLYRHELRRLALPLGAPFVVWGAWIVQRRAPTPELGSKRAFLLLVAGGYLCVMFGLWPLLSRQDYLPVIPLVAVLTAPALLAVSERVGALLGEGGGFAALAKRHLRWLVPACAAVASLAFLVVTGPPWRDGTVQERRLLAEVLSLTDGGDLVMDRKGEAIFRRRPFHPVLETVTLARIRRGLLSDDIGRVLSVSGTAVVVLDRHYPPAARGFVEENYLEVGSLRVAGRFLEPAAPGSFPFEIAIPGRYAIVEEHGPSTGRLDGTPYTGPRSLGPGRHEFQPSAGVDSYAVFWAQASERGFSPPWPVGKRPLAHERG